MSETRYFDMGRNLSGETATAVSDEPLSVPVKTGTVKPGRLVHTIGCGCSACVDTAKAAEMEAAEEMRQKVGVQFDMVVSALTASDIYRALRPQFQLGRFVHPEERVMNLPPIKQKPPEASPIAVKVGEDVPDEAYRKRVRKLGLRTAAVVQADLEEWLACQFIPVYDYKKVVQYMHHLCEVETAKHNDAWPSFTWAWIPLRVVDRRIAKRPNMSEGVPVRDMLYTKPIPEPVLDTIERVVDRWHNRVGMYVSDILKVPKPDPFLMITAPGLPCYVIERWDEPSFRS